MRIKTECIAKRAHWLKELISLFIPEVSIPPASTQRQKSRSTGGLETHPQDLKTLRTDATESCVAGDRV
jgi:hypothetical protein